MQSIEPRDRYAPARTPLPMSQKSAATAVPFFISLVLGAALLVFAVSPLRASSPEKGRSVMEAPEFIHRSAAQWINSEPLRLQELRGKVVLINFWAFACWNCYRSFPWLKAVEKHYARRGLQVIGVHTPEFDYEKVRRNVQKKVIEFGLHYPVMIDNDFSYWRAMKNRYWPAFYLVDKQGVLRSVFIGETHSGTAQAKKIEAAIERLLAES